MHKPVDLPPVYPHADPPPDTDLPPPDSDPPDPPPPDSDLSPPDSVFSPTDSDPPQSLLEVLKDRPYIFTKGKDILDKYIERNTTFAIQKAIALKIFSVAVLDGDGIVAACKLAAKLTGFSAEVV